MIKKINLNFANAVGLFFLLILVSFMTSNALIQLFTTLIILTGIVHLVINRENYTFFKKIPKFISLPILAFVLLGILTTFLNIKEAPLILDSLREYRWVFSYFFFSYLLFFFFNKGWVEKSQWTLLVSIIISLYAIWQAFYGMDLVTGDHSRVIGKEPLYRSIGTFGMPLTFAYLYGSLFFIFSSQIFNFKSNYKTKKIVILALSLLLLSVILSQTRGAWLAALLTLFVCGLFFVKKLRILLVVLLLASPIAYSFAPENFKKRVGSIVDVKADGVNKGRIYVWRAHYSRFKEKPWLGSGISNYEDYVSNFYQQNNIKSNLVSHAHNSYLHILSAQGVIGLIPFIIFHLGFIFMAIRCYLSKDIVYSAIGVSSFSTQMYLYLGGLTEAVFLDSELNQLLSLIWALTTVIYLRDKKQLRVPVQ